MTALPTWDQFMVPVLRVLADGQVRQRRQVYDLVAEAEQLTDEQRAEVLGSGQLRYENRVGWATSALYRGGALDRPSRGQYVITDVGRELLTENPDAISEARLKALPGFTETASEAELDADAGTELGPAEQIDQGISRIHAEVADDLLARLHGHDPAFFEQAVLDLLIAMGYGGADGAATRTQLTNDGGIDGIIDQDALGLSRIHVQAKRYGLDQTVERPQVQGFVGALAGNQANQGVFITTGRFSSGARDYVSSVPTRVVLIDGPRLATLMIRYGVGVQVEQTVRIVKVDEDFFE